MRPIHHLPSRALWLAAFVLLAPVSVSAQEALSRGSWLVGGTASLSVEDEDDFDENLVTLSIAPAVEYFVADRLALGGRIQIGYSSLDDASNTTFGIGPAIRYYFVEGGRVHPFVRGSVLFARSSFDSDQVENDSDFFGLRAEGGLLMLLSDAVGIDAVLFFDRSQADTDTSENEVNRFGVSLGVSAFVF